MQQVPDHNHQQPEQKIKEQMNTDVDSADQ